jgi:hypothetical protein
MPDLKVIEGNGPEKEEKERQQALEWAKDDFSWAIREVAANMLRIIRGAGKPYELLLQMKRAIDAAIKFQEVHQHWPQDVIANELRVQCEDEKIYAGFREGKFIQADLDRWRDDGTFDRMIDEHTILRGALQAIASELIGQSTQKIAGERELRDGIRSWIRNREARAQKLKQAHKVEHVAQMPKKPKRSRKDGSLA